MSKKKNKTAPINGSNGIQFLNGEGKIQLSMPKNPLEDLKWLPELVKSEDERLDIIERLGFPIIEQDAEGFVHVPLFPSQPKRDEDLLQEFINGKWRFMIAACTMRKRFPDKRHETTTRGFDVERVDAALPEIRERLKCRVWKSWDLNENQFSHVKMMTFLLGNSKELAGASTPIFHIQRKEVTNDYLQL